MTADALPVVMADRGEMVQVLQNLLGNAIKYRGEHRPHIHIASEPRGAHWEITVADDGPGIDPRHHDRIFVLLQRLHRHDEVEGTGMGLAICKKIIESHGGRIWVESREGEGARFTFTLPAAHDAPPRLAVGNTDGSRLVVGGVTREHRLRAAGAAGLAYVVLAGVENMEVLRAPAHDAGAADIRAAYADQALAAVTALAGCVSLAGYALFAVALAARRAPVLAAAIAGPLLALAGIVAAAPLVLGTAGSDDAVRDAYALQRDLRLLAGPCMALVVRRGRGARRAPPAARPAGRPLAAALALTPLALAGAGTGTPRPWSSACTRSGWAR